MGLTFATENVGILVVDDHPQMRKAILRILESYNFGSVFECAGGIDAIKILKDTSVDLVICDLYLLDTSGFEVLEFIRSQPVRADIPVIVVTGEASKEEIVKAADLGANDYLLKPFKPEDLQNKVSTLLNNFVNPDQLTRDMRVAEKMFFAKDYAGALKIADKIMAEDDQSVSARHLKALVLAKMRKEDLAIALHLENIDLNPSFYRSYSALADLYIARGNFAEAIKNLEQELELNPKQPKRQTQLATLLLEAGALRLRNHALP